MKDAGIVVNDIAYVARGKGNKLTLNTNDEYNAVKFDITDDDMVLLLTVYSQILKKKVNKMQHDEIEKVDIPEVVETDEIID